MPNGELQNLRFVPRERRNGSSPKKKRFVWTLFGGESMQKSHAHRGGGAERLTEKPGEDAGWGVAEKSRRGRGVRSERSFVREGYLIIPAT